MVKTVSQHDEVTRPAWNARTWNETASVIDRGAKRPQRAVYDARLAQPRGRAVARPRVALPPAPVPAPVARPVAAAQPRRNDEWPLWILAAVGSIALVAAGYLGALVQLGAPQLQAPRAFQQPATSLPRPETETRAMSTSVRVPAPSTVIRDPVRVVAPARRPNVHHVDVRAAALATAELERELYGQAAPASRIRSLPKPEAAAPGRVQPSRQDVQQALLAMRARIEACAAGRSGMVDARVGIAGTGRVTRALIQGDFAGTQQGSCMARALRAATVAPFSGPVVQVQFPFVL